MEIEVFFACFSVHCAELSNIVIKGERSLVTASIGGVAGLVLIWSLNFTMFRTSRFVLLVLLVSRIIVREIVGRACVLVAVNLSRSFLFLDAATHLYKRVCPSVGPCHVCKNRRNIVRALERASSDLYCPCPSVAASVGRLHIRPCFSI